MLFASHSPLYLILHLLLTNSIIHFYIPFFPIHVSCISADYFSLHGKNNTYDDLPIREFLESNELTVLAAINHGDKLIFSHNISEDENCLVFYKIPQIGSDVARQQQQQQQQSSIANTATDDDDNNDAGAFPLGIVTLEGGLAKSIYNSISRVYSPYVAKVN